MPDVNELRELLARVEAATDWDPELDSALVRAFLSDYEAGLNQSPGLRAYTASIDAAIDLVERALPAANRYGIDFEPRYKWTAYVSRNSVTSGHWHHEAEAPTAPLAMLMALLRALIAKAGP